ncbi:MAG: O-antigen ligase family protein [Mucilaginibacter sp.]
METTIKYIGLALLAALLCTCCITNDALINGIVNAKSVWFLFICGLALIYIATINIKSNIPLKLNNLDIAVTVFLLYLIANNVFHDGQLLARKNMEDAGLIVVYFFAKKLFINKQFPYRFFLILMIALVFSQIAIAVLQWFEYLPSYNSNFRFTGVFFNPSPFIIFFSAILIYCLTASLYSTNKIIKLTSLCLFIIALPIVAITFSRSAWLGLTAGTLLVLAIRFNWLKNVALYLKRTSIKIISISLLILIGSITAYYLYHLKKQSADGRLLVWKLSLNIIKDHPFNGIGQEKFSARIIEYQSAYFKVHPDRMITEGRLADTVYYTFNDLLQIAVEQGVVGLILFGMVLFNMFKAARQVVNNVAFSRSAYANAAIIGTISSAVIILVSGLFSYPLVMLPILITFFCLIGAISGNYHRTQPDTNSYNKKSSFHIPLYLLMGVFFLIYSVALGNAYYLGNNIAHNGYGNNAMNKLARYNLIVNTEEWYALRRCDYLLHIGQYKRATVEFEKAKAFTSNKVLYFSLGGLYEYQKQYGNAETNLKFIYYALPGLVTPKYRLAIFYHDTYQKIKWENAAKEVMNFQPKIVSPMSSEMIDEIRGLYFKGLNKVY